MKYIVTLNNKTYEVEVEEGQAILLDEYEAAVPAAPAQAAEAAPAPAAIPAPAPAAAAVTGEGEVVSAPMPGNILDIRAAEGAAVKAGDVVIILEAMKMENEIVAPKDGTITQIVAVKGSAVDTGAALFVVG